MTKSLQSSQTTSRFGNNEQVTFWFFYRQDVLVSDKNSFLVICPPLTVLPWTSRSFQSGAAIATVLIQYAGQPGSIGNSQLVSSMAKTLRSKGRPVKEQGKRIRKIDARFTQDEYDTILELEKTLGVRKSDLVRIRLLQDARLAIVNAKELIGFIDSIGAEMGRCGNNINQLAKYANILKKKGVLSPMVIERFTILFEQYIEYQKQLEIALRNIIRMAGR